MEKEKELLKRKPTRLHYFDYNSSGAYFITICTKNRRNLLSRIVGTGVPDCPQNNALYSPKRVELLSHGKIADKYIKQLNGFYNHLSVEKYVIMPNHIHLLIWVKENKNTSDNGQSRTPVPTINVPKHRGVVLPSPAGEGGPPKVVDEVFKRDVISFWCGQSRTPVPTNIERSNNTCSKFVSTFKRFCNKEIGENIWQARFNDHIIRNQKDYEEHIKYIHENPARWYFDELYSE